MSAPSAADPGVRPGLVVARIAAILALWVGALLVLRPFLTAIAWAAVLAYVTWPAYRRLRTRVRRPRLAALVLTAGVIVGIAIPMALLLVTLGREGSDLLLDLRDWAERGAPLPQAIQENWWLRRIQDWLRDSPLGDASQAGSWLGRVGAELSGRLVDLGTGVARNAFRLLVTVLTLYAFYVNGEQLVELARAFVPLLFPAEPDRFLERIGSSVNAVMYGLVGTALAQGLLAGLGMALSGVPSAVAIGTATALISFVPGGPSGLSLAAAGWLALQDRLGAAIFLAVWAVLVVGSADNVLRPLLISGRGRIPFLLVFFGVLGGLTAFGLIGLLIGPVLLVVARALVEEFVRLHPPTLRSRVESAP